MFAEMAATSRDTGQATTSVYSKEVPWGELSPLEQKKIVMMVYFLPQMKELHGVGVGMAVHSVCKDNPELLRD
ncbi:hypothetical protein GTP23_21360 [Pseudoduganella sp. FT93W]|uniref:Uncharacterized protein n=1 Tax=Duganella fentianensis TaxID=2692177 RepID=A0A845I585_9BURK|nr:hypothetical protein [Duganella fentianensis]MYN47597.1 hypothetical protein [Duganella fentianensis]